MLTRAQTRLIGRRLLQILPVVVLATFVVFGLLQLVPGDIAITLAGENATEVKRTPFSESTRCRTCLVSTSHSANDWSLLAVASFAPSGDKAIRRIWDSCPS